MFNGVLDSIILSSENAQFIQFLQLFVQRLRWFGHCLQFAEVSALNTLGAVDGRIDARAD